MAPAVVDVGQLALAARLRTFFEQCAGDDDYAMVLEGMPPLAGTVGEWPQVNQNAVMGLVPAEVLCLKGTTLWNGQTKTSVEDSSDLWQVLTAIKTGRWGVLLGYGFGKYCDTGLWQAMTEYPKAEEVAGFPDLLLVRFEDWLTLNWHTGELIVETHDETRRNGYLKRWESLQFFDLPKEETTPVPADVAAYASGFSTSFTQPAFEAAVEQVKTAIEAGELYQANLTLRLQKEVAIEPLEVYGALSRQNPSPFSGVLHWPGGWLLSNSPERLVAVDKGGKISMRPIAGTRGRGGTPEEDVAIGQTLLCDEKERAEHLMLVDLARNDVGRVAEPGSVTVDELLVLERYSHVTHLVSNVVGQRAQNQTLWDVIKATFPGGTITGCPKIRCVQVLSQLEPVARGLYTGGLGWMDFEKGTLDVNILIRSLFLQATATPLLYNGSLHVGAGIVADSVPAHEYRECFRKAAAILGVLSRYDQHCH